MRALTAAGFAATATAAALAAAAGDGPIALAALCADPAASGLAPAPARAPPGAGGRGARYALADAAADERVALDAILGPGAVVPLPGGGLRLAAAPHGLPAGGWLAARFVARARSCLPPPGQAGRGFWSALSLHRAVLAPGCRPCTTARDVYIRRSARLGQAPHGLSRVCIALHPGPSAPVVRARRTPATAQPSAHTRWRRRRWCLTTPP